MATKKKLNVKFLAIVLGVAGLGLGAVAVVVLLQYRADPVKHIRSGDELLAEGRPTKAFQQYLRGIGKAPFEMAYYDKAIDAAERIQPETNFEANEALINLFSTLIAKAEKAQAQDGLSAREVRDQTLARVLDELRIYTFGVGQRPAADQSRAFGMLDRMLRPVDDAIGQIPESERSPRIAAAVRGATLEDDWRSVALATDRQWEELEEALEEAIELDPGYVPGWYALLRAQLLRTERVLLENGVTAARRMLEDEDRGFLATLARARETLGDTPSPELDLLEFELAQIAFYSDAAGDGPDGLVPMPDLAMLRDAMDRIPDLEGLPGWESRWRFEELMDEASRILSRPTIAVVDGNVVGSIRDAVEDLLGVTVQSIRRSDPDDVRTLLIDLTWSSQELQQDGDDTGRLEELVAAGLDLEREGVGIRSLFTPQVRRTATGIDLDRRLEAALRSVLEGETLDDEMKAGLESAMNRMEVEFTDSATGKAEPRLLEARMAANTVLAANADVGGDDAAEVEFFAVAERAANQLRLVEDYRLGRFGLNSALLLAERRGDWGLAVDLFVSAGASRNADMDLQLRYVNLLQRAGRFEQAAAVLAALRDSPEAAADPVLLARMDDLAREVESRAGGETLDSVAGADLLAESAAAARRGDVAAQRNTLDQIIEDDSVPDRVRMLALRRRASLEASLDEFDEARRFAAQILEIEPRDSLGLLIMQSDADTSLLERCRVLANNAAEDEAGREVALARLIRDQLRDLDATRVSEEERDELTAELARLDTAFAAAVEPGVELLQYLTESALLEKRMDEARRQAERLAAAEASPTTSTILLRAQVLNESGALDDAIALIRDAIENEGLGDDRMFGILGDFLAIRGDREGSMDAFQTAFRYAPTRPANALKLAEALLASGRTTEALPVLRAARATGRENPAFFNRWLLEEVRVGNHQVAIEERRRRLEFRPSDFLNAIGLVQMLVQSPIGREDVLWTREDVRNARRGAVAGEPRFSEAEWARLVPSLRQVAVKAGRDARMAEAAEILDQLQSIDPTDPSVVVASAAFLIEADAVEGPIAAHELRKNAIDTLRAELAAASDPATARRLELRLSRMLHAEGDALLRGMSAPPKLGEEGPDAEAAALFAEAAALEGDDVSDIETLVSSTYQGLGKFDEAIPYQARLLEEREKAGTSQRDRTRIARRLLDLLVTRSRLEEAQPIVDRYFDESSTNLDDLVALGTFSLGKALSIRLDGETPDLGPAFAELDAAQRAFDRAAAVRANDLDIAVRQFEVARLRHLWSADADRVARYKEVEDLATSIASRFANNWRARNLLVRTLRLAGGGDGSAADRKRRYAEAINQTRGFLEIMPNDIRATLALVNMLEADGQMTSALDVGQSALDRDPDNVTLAGRVGMLRQNMGQSDEAARQMGLLFERTGNPLYLQFQMRALLESDEPNVQSVIELARANAGLVTASPYLGGMYAAAIKFAGQPERALRDFQAIYRTARQKADARPDSEKTIRWNALDLLARSFVLMFEESQAGGEELAAYIEDISEGDPTLSDLFSLSRHWANVASIAADEGRTAAETVAMQNAVEVLRRASLIEPGHPECFAVYMRLGILLERLGDCASAVEAFDQAFALRSDQPDVMNNLAYLILQCEGDVDRARELAEQATELRPENASYQDTLAFALMEVARKTSDPDAAAGIRQRARFALQEARVMGVSVTPRIRMAELELEEGRLEEARNALVEAGDLEPTPDQQAEIDELIARIGASSGA